MNYKISRSDLVSFKLPKGTKSYTPVANEMLVDVSMNAFDKEGFTLNKEEHRACGGRNIFISNYIFNYPGSDIGLMFAIINSYNKSRRVGYALGGHVFVCENGMVNGDIASLRKHTGFADVIMKLSIEDGVKKMSENYISLQNDVNRMKEIEISKKLCAQIIGEMYINEAIVNSVQLSIIKNEIEHCSYDYGVENTLFNLYQNTTCALKTSHPNNYINSHIKLHKYLTGTFS